MKTGRFWILQTNTENGLMVGATFMNYGKLLFKAFINVFFFSLDLHRSVFSHETKIDILREIYHRRVKNYARDKENTSRFKRSIKSKLDYLRTPSHKGSTSRNKYGYIYQAFLRQYCLYIGSWKILDTF